MGSLAKKMRKKGMKEFKRSERRKAALDAKARFDAAYSMEKQDEKLRDGTTDYMMITYTYALYHNFHFGMKRIERFFERAVEFSRYIRTGWSPVEEWERALREEAGWSFKHAAKEKRKHSQQVMLEGIETLLVIFQCAMFIEFGFAKTRLQKIYVTLQAVSAALKKNLYSLEDLEHLLAKKNICFEKVAEEVTK